MKDLTTLAAAVALLDQPGLLEMSAVFQPLVVNQETFVRSENGTFGLRLVRPETGEEVVLDFRDLVVLHEELVLARRVLDDAEDGGIYPMPKRTLWVDDAAWLAWQERRR